MRLLASLFVSVRTTQAKLHEVATQHTSVTEQFSQALEEKDHKISLLESKFRRLLSAVRGSRQERIDPDQLLLFSQEELKQLAQELEKSAADNASEPDQPSDQPQDPATPEQSAKKKGGRRPLPAHWPKEILRHELSEEERKCPCCGKTRHEMGVETSQQIEFIHSVFKIVEHQRVQYDARVAKRTLPLLPSRHNRSKKGYQPQGFVHTCLIQIR